MTLMLRILLLFLITIGITAGEVTDRDKRQSQPYFAGGLSGRPTPKPQPFGFPGLGGPPPQGFRSATPVEEEDELDRNAVAPTPSPLIVPRQQPAAQTTYRSQAPIHQPQPQQQQIVLRTRPAPSDHDFGGQQSRRAQQNRGQQLTEEELEELEEEKEEPDRLTLLLPQSKFSCHGKNTGYYADDGLNCEVFHYCQDNARHSWICPEGFLFHQVHLICMPPSSDNICKQSSQFHFVNEYLYRPINAEEAQTKPNVTLRYADRYYPENFYEEGEEHQGPPASQRVKQQQQQQPQQTLRPGPPPQFRQPITNQVFHSPEEVNIPLQHRRPVPNSPPQRNYHPSDDFDF